MQEEDIKSLLKKYSSGTASPEEKALVEAWYAQQDTQLKVSTEDELDAIEDWLLTRLPQPESEVRVRRLWPRIAAAASVLILLGTGAYFILHKNHHEQIAQQQSHDVAPGRNQATIVLAGGKQIILTKGLSGKLGQQGNTAIAVNGSNAVAYEAAGQKTAEVTYNTMFTKRGEQSPYALVLADGTKVWLNAASSITYPTAFTGKERIVKVTGEAYFEVAHNASQPFKVEAGGQTIQDIGTAFDVNAYTNEPVFKTTLLQGSISIQDHILKPGQQAQVSSNTIHIISDANTQAAIAWRDGYFRFTGEDMDAVMRQFERWYDIKVVYNGPMKEHQFVGRITRQANLSKVLEILTTSGVRYQINDHKLTIEP